MLTFIDKFIKWWNDIVGLDNVKEAYYKNGKMHIVYYDTGKQHSYTLCDGHWFSEPFNWRTSKEKTKILNILYPRCKTGKLLRCGKWSK